MLADSEALVEALCDAEVLADSLALVEALCDALVLADSLALVEALCDALVLADSDALVEALCDATYLLIRLHLLKHSVMLRCLPDSLATVEGIFVMLTCTSAGFTCAC